MLEIWSDKKSTWPTVPFCTVGNPSHHHIWSQICRWHPPHQLASRRQWALLHEVQVNSMVSIISIFKQFEYLVSYIVLDFMIYAWTLCLFPCFTLVVEIVP
jgi:hypothetical protein